MLTRSLTILVHCEHLPQVPIFCYQRNTAVQNKTVIKEFLSTDVPALFILNPCVHFSYWSHSITRVRKPTQNSTINLTELLPPSVCQNTLFTNPRRRSNCLTLHFRSH